MCETGISSELFCGIFWKSFNALSTLKESSHSEKLDVAFWNGFVEMERKKKKGETLNCEGNIKASGIDNFNYGSSSNCLKGESCWKNKTILIKNKRISTYEEY